MEKGTARAGAQGHPGDSPAWDWEWQALPRPRFATLQLRKVFYAKAFSWFFEMGLVT